MIERLARGEGEVYSNPLSPDRIRSLVLTFIHHARFTR